MDFAAFESSIVSENLRAIARHWQSARGQNALPAWSDIRPSAIAKQLPIVWSFTYDAAQDEFVGKLGGEAITLLVGRSLKGAHISDLGNIQDQQ